MDKDLYATRKPFKGSHCISQKIGRTGRCRTTMQPMQIKIGHGVESVLGFRAANFDEGDCLRARAESLQSRADRRDRGFIAHKQMPVGGRIGRVRTTGSTQVHDVAGFRIACPWASNAGVAVDHKVDRKFLRRPVDPTNRECAKYRPRRLRHDIAQGDQVQRVRIIDRRIEKHQLDVAISWQPTGERWQGFIPLEKYVEPVAAENDPLHFGH